MEASVAPAQRAGLQRAGRGRDGAEPGHGELSRCGDVGSRTTAQHGAKRLWDDAW